MATEHRWRPKTYHENLTKTDKQTEQPIWNRRYKKITIHKTATTHHCKTTSSPSSTMSSFDSGDDASAPPASTTPSVVPEGAGDPPASAGDEGELIVVVVVVVVVVVLIAGWLLCSLPWKVESFYARNNRTKWWILLHHTSTVPLQVAVNIAVFVCEITSFCHVNCCCLWT